MSKSGFFFKKSKMKRIFLIIILIIFVFSNTIAQVDSLESADKGTVWLNVPVQVFFKNNEYKRKIAYGYTLGGVRMIPNLEYQPLENFSVNAGINVLRYWGADQYGQYSFINIPYYSDTNTQKQLHWKPYFRADWQINGSYNLIMGNIYTASSHYLPVPLYNRELLYSSDGEEGVQFLATTKYWCNDLWVNWQNFNFFNDVDRESFDLGTSGFVHTSCRKKCTAYLNYAFIWHHNGGELDTVASLPLDHWANGRIGGAFEFHTMSLLDFEIWLSLDYLFSKDMKNSTLPFKSGHAWFPALTCSNDKWKAVIGYYDSKDMITFYGTNFFSNLAQRDNSITYPYNKMLYGSFNYSVHLEKSEHNVLPYGDLSFVGEFFYKFDGNNSVGKETKGLSFGLGMILTIKPHIKLYELSL